MPAIPLNHVVTFKQDFAHPTDPIGFGVPLSCTLHHPIIERGQRRQWRYVISYARRVEQHTFILKCPSLPVEISRSAVIAAVIRTRRQNPHPEFFQKLEGIKHRMTQTLQNRRDDEFIPGVERFLDSFPSSALEAHDSFCDILALLSKDYGNDVYTPPHTYTRGKLNVMIQYIYIYIPTNIFLRSSCHKAPGYLCGSNIVGQGFGV